MGLPAFKLEFEELVASVPPVSLSVAPSAVAGTNDSPEDIAGRHTLEMLEALNTTVSDWRASVSGLLVKFEELADRSSSDPDRRPIMRFACDVAAPQMINRIDDVIQRLEALERSASDLQSEAALDQFAKRSPTAKRHVREYRRRRDIILGKRLRDLYALRERVRIFIWDNDPDARPAPDAKPLASAQDIEDFFAVIKGR